MRILLDTNVWRYLVDANLQDDLFKVSHRSGAIVCVAPCVVIETLRLNDPLLRSRIVELLTRNCWQRLMPDAYLQCEDVKAVMLERYPEWRLAKPNLALYKRLRYEWIRKKGGWWDKVRNKPDQIAERYLVQDEQMLSEVLSQSRDLRARVHASRERLINTKRLDEFEGSWTDRKTGKRVTGEFWKVWMELIWGNLLQREDTVFRQWLGCEIDVDHLLWGGAEQWLNFFQFEIVAGSVPREWTRAAIYCLQSDRKVTTGNPLDSTISSHLVDVEVVASADKNFVSMINRIQAEAPFRSAHGFLIEAGAPGIARLLDFLSKPFAYSIASTARH